MLVGPSTVGWPFIVRIRGAESDLVLVASWPSVKFRWFGPDERVTMRAGPFCCLLAGVSQASIVTSFDFLSASMSRFGGSAVAMRVESVDRELPAAPLDRRWASRS
jgi:hypothetical protein